MTAGTSACRQLVLHTPEQVTLLNFTADGPYEALLASDSAALPEEQLVLSGGGWLRIYDDEEMTFLAWADKIRVYADGDNPCINGVLPKQQKANRASCSVGFLLAYFSAFIRSLTTSPARIRPTTEGTKATLPGVLRRPG